MGITNELFTSWTNEGLGPSMTVLISVLAFITKLAAFVNRNRKEERRKAKIDTIKREAELIQVLPDQDSQAIVTNYVKDAIRTMYVNGNSARNKIPNMFSFVLGVILILGCIVTSLTLLDDQPILSIISCSVLLFLGSGAILNGLDPEYKDDLDYKIWWIQQAKSDNQQPKS